MLIKSFGWEVSDYAPYSPRLAPIDFLIFRYLKHSLGGKCFSDNEEVKAAVNSAVRPGTIERDRFWQILASTKVMKSTVKFYDMLKDELKE
ncbi:hypothetical protein TNCV_990661 [Trichonephila clavipes]|nr:hypothetical protein TNCV_990661 [Trichonephila clavipes]